MLRPGDVLLVEGNRRISVAIKYVTQSTWSHAALYVGDALAGSEEGVCSDMLVESDLSEGVIAAQCHQLKRRRAKTALLH